MTATAFSPLPLSAGRKGDGGNKIYHRGDDSAILQQRHALYQAAKGRHPERWSGPTRNWEPEKFVYLNPGKPMKKEGDLKQKAA